MPIGVGAAMLIGSAVAGGSAIGAAKLQSNAASKAQKAQQAATDQALAVQQQTSKPYTDLGTAAAGRLGQMAANAQPYTQQFRGPQPSNGYQAPPQMPGPPPTLGGIGMQQPQPPQPSPMVTLQAPDGSTRQFLSMDAQRIIQQARAAGHELRMVN